MPPVATDFTTAQAATSIIETSFAASLATNRRRESGVNRMPRGFFGTSIFFTTASVAVSIT